MSGFKHFFIAAVFVCWLHELTDGVGDWRCGGGEIIHSSFRCDGHNDCYDETDEKNCDHVDCHETQFRCLNDSKCIPHGLVCNMVHDCLDGSDEENCEETPYCRSDQFYCNMDCIPQDWVCDGEDDCGHQEDETDCARYICPQGEIRCNVTNICISEYWLCDGEGDCADGLSEEDDEDERNCNQSLNSVVVTEAVSSVCYLRKNLTVWNDEVYMDELVCDQVCDVEGSTQPCSCGTGYRVDPSKPTKCLLSNAFPPFLYFVSGSHILRRDLRDDESQENIVYRLPDSRPHVMSLEVDTNTNSLIWVEMETGNVNFLRTDDSYHIVLPVSAAVAVALDWMTPNLYVACRSTVTAQGHVTVIPLLRVQQPTDNMQGYDIRMFDDPVSIALHPKKGVMLVADQGNTLEPSRIVLMNMDGSDAHDFEVEQVRTIHCVTIDYVTDVVYWSESNLMDARIEMKAMDGRLSRTLLMRAMDVVALRSPFSLTLYENRLVFSDNSSGDIWRIDSMIGKPEGYPHNHEPLYKGLDASSVLAVHVAHPSLHPYSEEATACQSPTQCSHACALIPAGWRCLCPRGRILAPDRFNCIENEETVPGSTTTAPTTNTQAPLTQTQITAGGNNVVGHGEDTEFSVTTCSIPPLPRYVQPVGDEVAMTKPVVTTDVTVRFRCLPGSHVANRPMATEFSVTCLLSGQWNASIAASCVEWTCAELDCGKFGSCVSTALHAAVCKCPDNVTGFTSCNKPPPSTEQPQVQPSPEVASISAEPSKATPNPKVSFFNRSTSAPPASTTALHDVITGVLTSYLGKILGVVVAIVLIGGFVCYMVYYCAKKSRDSFEVHYTAQPRRKWRATRRRVVRTDGVGEMPGIDNNNCITNPNYSSPNTPKVRLALPDDLDSGVDRSSSSLSSSDCAYEPITGRVTSSALDPMEEEDRLTMMSTERGRRRSVIRSAFRSIFNIRKTESQEHMLPRP